MSVAPVVRSRSRRHAFRSIRRQLLEVIAIFCFKL